MITKNTSQSQTTNLSVSPKYLSSNLQILKAPAHEPNSSQEFNYPHPVTSKENLVPNHSSMIQVSNEQLKQAISDPILLANLLSCFIQEAELHRMPLLLIGSNSRKLIDAFNTKYELLDLNTINSHADFVQALSSSKAYLVISNMFKHNWSDFLLPLATHRTYGQVFWMHPYYDDIMIQPKSIFNFAYPLISDFFMVDKIVLTKTQIPSCTNNELWPIDDLQSLGLSRLFLNTVSSLLKSTYYRYLSQNQVDESLLIKSAINLLFALAPTNLLAHKN